MNQLKGIHHVTAMTSSAKEIYNFFTNILSLRLVKKTINQDDPSAYHLFFADNEGNAGTDMTFFEFKHSNKALKGTNEIAKTGFRVPTDKALDYWIKRFDHYQVRHDGITTLFGRKLIYFYDFDGQEYALFSDEGIDGVKSGVPWENGPVPNEFAITGLGPVFFRVDDLKRMNETLITHMGMRLSHKDNRYSLYEMGEGGNGATVIVDYQPMIRQAFQGYGGVHHVAFRIHDRAELDAWIKHLEKIPARHSGYVDRFYFKSLYTRLYPYILFEFATEGPGFIDDEEDLLHLGEKLALPPRFRNQRAYVENQLDLFDTIRSNKTFTKEYF